MLFQVGWLAWVGGVAEWLMVSTVVNVVRSDNGHCARLFERSD